MSLVSKIKKAAATTGMAATLSLTGCMSGGQTSITFNPIPAGAQIYTQGQHCGYAPVTRYWNSNVVAQHSGNMGVYTAYWPDGFKLDKHVTLKSASSGKYPHWIGHYNILFHRPYQPPIVQTPQQQQQQQQTIIIERDK